MPTENSKPSLRGFFATWIILTIVGVAISLYAPVRIMPRSMSQNMHLSILTIVVFSVAAAPVAAGVYAATLHILRHHTFRGDTPPAAADSTRENPRVVTSWVLASTILTVFLLVWGLGALAVDENASSKTPLEVNVTGQQWVWTFSYPGTHVTTHDLYLPVGREVEFRVSSKDVTHGFWIPQMGIQVDANTDAVTTFHTTPSATGTFDVRCTQFCGLNHAYMITVGHVLTDSAFNQWLASQPTQS